MTLPGIAEILAATIALEIGDIGRFPDAPHLASYAGTTPRVHASGGRVRYGRLRTDVNRYLKWAFVEAANSVAVNHRRCPERHVSQLYDRLRQRKGHHKAIGAVARHLAEAAFHVVRRQEAYRDAVLERGCTSVVGVRMCHEPLARGMNATHLRIISCPREGGEMTGYTPGPATEVWVEIGRASCREKEQS